jgi:2-C-methyl-D-erythritol 2,4-cyclodiphosphate synthase
MTGGGVPAGTCRVGQGFDVHRFSGDPGRPLVLGGVTVPGAAGLAGHSDLLGRVSSMVQAEGMRLVNADCTVVCERPRLVEHTDEMVRRLQELLGAPVSVKAKRAEGLGALGRVEGIACLAVVLLTATA